MENIHHWLQEGVVDVNLDLLQKFSLLDPSDEKGGQESFPFYFHVIETPEKVTLFNNQFVVWIIPRVIDELPSTLVLIALAQKDDLHLEIAFSTKGDYNTPKYVLKTLRYYLTEVLETEEAIASIQQGDASC